MPVVRGDHAGTPCTGARTDTDRPMPHPGGRRGVRVVTLTISDTGTAADDTSGAVLREGLRAAGFELVRHAIVPDDPVRVRDEIVRAVASGEADAVVSTGG